jgi:hypothetical protein
MTTDTARIIYLPEPDEYIGRHRRPSLLDRARTLFSRRPAPADTPLPELLATADLDATVTLEVA